MTLNASRISLQMLSRQSSHLVRRRSSTAVPRRGLTNQQSCRSAAPEARSVVFCGQNNGGGTARSFSSDDSNKDEPSLVAWSVDEASKVGTITLQSPNTYNALTVEMGRDFERLITQIEKELYGASNVQAIVLQGAGEQAFSAGGNLKWLLSLHNNSVHANTDAMLQFYNSFLSMRQKIPVPIIGALPGPAMGAGACLALACDLRVAASGDVPILGFPFSKLGIPSGMGGLYMLQQQGFSAAKATEILVLGQTLTGEQADAFGLINRLVPVDQVKSVAHELAAEIAQKHPVAIRSLIRSWRLGKDAGLAEALYRDAHAEAMCYNREDWGKGLAAVAEKREAEFDVYHSK